METSLYLQSERFFLCLSLILTKHGRKLDRLIIRWMTVTIIKSDMSSDEIESLSFGSKPFWTILGRKVKQFLKPFQSHFWQNFDWFFLNFSIKYYFWRKKKNEEIFSWFFFLVFWRHYCSLNSGIRGRTGLPTVALHFFLNFCCQKIFWRNKIFSFFLI